MFWIVNVSENEWKMPSFVKSQSSSVFTAQYIVIYLQEDSDMKINSMPLRNSQYKPMHWLIFLLISVL